MRTIVTLVVLGVLSTTARADAGEPEMFTPRVAPDTARWISAATTTAGLGLSGYIWYHAGGLERGMGREDAQLLSVGTGLVTLGIGPAAGLFVAGDYRRGMTGAYARPLVIGGGGAVLGLGLLIGKWGCMETTDCTGAKIASGALAGVGGAAIAGGIAWAVHDIWETPKILRKRMARQLTLAPMVGGNRAGVSLTVVH